MNLWLTVSGKEEAGSGLWEQGLDLYCAMWLCLRFLLGKLTHEDTAGSLLMFPGGQLG